MQQDPDPQHFLELTISGNLPVMQGEENRPLLCFDDLSIFEAADFSAFDGLAGFGGFTDFSDLLRFSDFLDPEALAPEALVSDPSRMDPAIADFTVTMHYKV